VLAALAATMAFAAPSALAAPTASFSVAPAAPQSGVAATYTSTSTAPTGFNVTTVEWDFDGDPSTFEATGTSVQHTFATSGAHTFRMRVTSDELLLNQTTEEKTVTVVTRAPTAAFTFNPASPLPGDSVLFASNSSDPDGDSLTHSWDFGDGSGPNATRNPAHTYTTPGTKTVRLTVNDGHGGVDDVTQTITVKDPSAAKASFTFTPDSPVANQTVTFTSTSTPSAGQSIKSQDWDLDSDGKYDDGSGKTATAKFDSPGVYRIALRVVQANNNPAVAEGTVRVGQIAQAPATPSTPSLPVTPGKPTKARLSLLTPFPVVRLAGQAYRRRTLIIVLSVQAPKGALVRVRCKGHGCPKVVRSKRSKGAPVRFKTFERRIRAGAKLEVFVFAKRRIGKYTRFKMLSGKPPQRTDACVLPGRTKPRPCPS
jgi:PKD repeat protein